jgi:hypothetical protein
VDGGIEDGDDGGLKNGEISVSTDLKLMVQTEITYPVPASAVTLDDELGEDWAKLV